MARASTTLFNLSLVFFIFIFSIVILESIIFIKYWNRTIIFQILNILGSFEFIALLYRRALLYSSSIQKLLVYIYMHFSDTEYQGRIFSWSAAGLKSLSSAYICNWCLWNQNKKLLPKFRLVCSCPASFLLLGHGIY